MTIQLDSRVGQIAAEHPSATKVFARHQIDFCCGGGKPLGEVCERRGLDAQAVLAEIERELALSSAGEANAVGWDEAPLGAVIDHILITYHKPLKEELPRLGAMAEKVVAVHGDKRPDILPEILTVFNGLKAELEEHMAKEEQILFPMIQAGRGEMAGSPISLMEHEHDEAGKALKRLRELTDGYEAPADACNTWRALWHGLGELETSLHQHIHLENNILFPRALGSE